MLELTAEGNLQHATHFNRSYGGDTFNTAVALSRLGSSVGYITRISEDPFGPGLREMAQDENIALYSRLTKAPTAAYFISVDADGERTFSYYRQNSAPTFLSPEDISPEIIRKAKVVYASGITLAISESARKTVLKAFRLARECNVLTAFDPNYRAALWHKKENAVDAYNEILPLVDVFLPSFPEDTTPLLGFRRPEQVAEFFMHKGPRLTVVKAGADGCYVGFKREVLHRPTQSVVPVDTTGAGDAFNGGFLHGLATDQSLIRCAKLGMVTAALKCLNRGSAAAMPSREAVYQRAFGNSEA